MKSLKLMIPLVLVLMIVTGCSSIRISSDYDRKANFREYRTFNFTKEVDRVNLSGLNRDRLKDNIAGQMESRGYRMASTPDLLVNVFIKGKTKMSATATTFGNPWGWGYYGWWGGHSSTYVDVNKYVEGTMFIDVIDVQKKRMIWEGIAEGMVNPRTQTTEKDLNKVVTRIFENFPK